MKRFLSLIMLSPAICAVMNAAAPVYTSADSFDLIGRGISADASVSRYQRLPDSLESIVPRQMLWTLGQNTAGMALRFASDSPSVSLRWRSTGKVEMNHMTPTGIRGLDLYCLMPDSTWRFVNSARPALDDASTETCVIDHMEPGIMREFMLYLPLYDGIADLEIGIDGDYTIRKSSVGLPATGNPIVAYGTSILQGGCASRPGMCHSNIIMRRLNREFINFGFSGNGQLDMEIAPVVASVDNPALVILDFVPNVSEELIERKMIPFYNVVRAAHPDVPILLVENPIFPHSAFDGDMASKVAALNKALRGKYETLKASGDNNLYYLPADSIIGDDGEATVDGIHFTDLGFSRYADLLTGIIKDIIRQ